jgi:hypothetical protein
MTREEYLEKYFRYRKMSIEQLQKNVKELYSRKFEYNDITAYEEHRIATRALVERERDGSGLLFHMKQIVLKSC